VSQTHEPIDKISINASFFLSIPTSPLFHLAPSFSQATLFILGTPLDQIPILLVQSLSMFHQMGITYFFFSHSFS